jgi:hypothetical protein
MSRLEKGEHYSETYGAARRERLLMAGVVDWLNKDSLAASERASCYVPPFFTQLHDFTILHSVLVLLLLSNTIPPRAHHYLTMLFVPPIL